MIWIWIVIAMFISWLFCERKIGWYHYIWLLLPVEMYGITVAGATIKPYMIFGMCIIIADFLKKKTIRVHVSIIIAMPIIPSPTYFMFLFWINKDHRLSERK